MAEYDYFVENPKGSKVLTIIDDTGITEAVLRFFVGRSLELSGAFRNEM